MKLIESTLIRGAGHAHVQRPVLRISGRPRHLFIHLDEAQDSMDLALLLSLLLSFTLAEARILTDLSDGFCRSYQFGGMP
jgi:hypothetical protein